MTTVNIFKHEEDAVTVPADQTIFREGETGDVMYVVQEGEVDITIRDRLLETVGPGGVIGEMALIDSSARSATAVTRTDCKLVPLDEERFKIQVHHTPFFAIQVMRVMAGRLRRMDEQL
jgi:CRP-like cAMP-binding protein